jgi:hypothetical protein
MLSFAAPQVLSYVTTTNADCKNRGQSRGKSREWYPTTKLIADFQPCNTFGVKLSDCLLSEGESINDVVDCFQCIDEAYVNFLLVGEYICADLKEIGYCDAMESCSTNACNNLCSDEIKNEENCFLIWDGCDDGGKDGYYGSKCHSGI